MELRRLQYFLAVAEELHFGRAAARLHIVQPAVSRQIALLESELGLQLLNRTRRRVALTPAGEVFASDVREILRRLAHAVDSARRVAAGGRGRLDVGFIGPAMDSFLPRVLSTHRSEFPDVVVDLHELGSAAQVEGIRDGTLDCCFVRLPVRAEDLSQLTMSRESIVVALPEGHGLVGRRHISPKSLASERFVMVARDWEPGLFEIYTTLCVAAGFTPTVAQETNSLHSMLGLVAAEMGIAFVPASVSELRRKHVVYRPLRDPRLLEVAALWRDDNPSSTLPAFLDVARRYAIDSSTDAASPPSTATVH